MNARIRELRQQRAQLIADARKILDTAEGEKRALSQEEENNYNDLWSRVEGLTSRIEREEQLAAAEESARRTDGRIPSADAGPDSEGLDYEFRSRGLAPLNDASARWYEGEPWSAMAGYARDEYRSYYRNWLRFSETHEELRALQADNSETGGYLVTPLQFVDRLIQAVDNAVFIRQWATVHAVPRADSLGAPSLDSDPSDPTWTSELKIGSEDSSMKIGRRELHPHPLAKSIKLSRKLLRMVPDVEELVSSRLAYKFAVTQENAFLNGSGSNQPLGVFVASSQGISTGRDVSTGNTSTSIEFDGLIEAKYTLKPSYWPRARWLFHRDGVKQIAKLKDGDGAYIWRESVRVGEPDRLLNLPVFMSEYAPNTFTTGQYVGILGDFSFFWIADAMAMDMQRLVELYAGSNQVGFIGRLETDGMPVLEEAFVRVKLA